MQMAHTYPHIQHTLRQARWYSDLLQLELSEIQLVGSGSQLVYWIEASVL